MIRTFVIIVNNKVKNITSVDKNTIEESIQFLNTYFNDPDGFWKYIDPSLEKNKCAVNCNYNSEEDYFFTDKPLNSWVFNKEKYRWEPPISYPEGEWDNLNYSSNNYEWNESLLNWVSKT